MKSLLLKSVFITTVLLGVSCSDNNGSRIPIAKNPGVTDSNLNPETELDSSGLPLPSKALPIDETQPAPEVFISGEKEFKFEPFKLPDVIIARKERRGEAPAVQSNAYEMHESQLVIDLEKEEMRLRVDIEAKGKREQLFLSGSFEKEGHLWTSQLYAQNQKIKEERRVQAVIMCLRPFICDQIWMDLYYVIDGKLEKRQFVVGASKPQISLSEEVSIPLPEPDKSGMIEIPVLQPEPMEVPEQEAEPQVEAEDEVEGETEDEVQSESEAESESESTSEEQEVTQYPLDHGLKMALLEQEARKKALEQEQAQEQESSVNMPPLPRRDPRRSQESESNTTESEEKTDVVPYPMPPLDRSKLEPQTQKLHIDEVVIEYETQPELPPPAEGPYQVQGFENLNVDLSHAFKTQAIRKHNGGSLVEATILDSKGCGFKRRNTFPAAASQAQKNEVAVWGTDLMIELLTGATCAVEKEIPGRSPLLIGDMARREGGQFKKHSSHQTGLDVDVAFYHRNESVNWYWYPLKNLDQQGKPLANNFEKNFDYERNWLFLKALHSTDDNRTMIVFLDRRIKQKLCSWVKRTEGLPTDPNSAAYKALRYLSHWEGHDYHYHIRMYCPGTVGCINTQADPKGFEGIGCS